MFLMAEQLGNAMQVGASIVDSLDGLVEIVSRAQDEVTCEACRCNFN